jgi:hypothetical protein
MGTRGSDEGLLQCLAPLCCFWQATFSLILASFWDEKGSRLLCFKNVASTRNKFSVKKKNSEKPQIA